MLVRDGYAAFGAGDLALLEAMFSPDCVWHEPGNSPISGTYKGWPETARLFGEYAQRSGGTFTAELHDVLANDTYAFSIATVRGDREGRHLDQGDHVLFTVRDGRIVDARAFYHDQAVVDAFWA
jgi:hypothetical protein